MALAWHAPAAHGQGARFPRVRRATAGPRAAFKGQGRAPQDPAALALLRRKIKPSADYAGEQVTELQNGRTSRQRIEGDTKGRLRIDYLSPPGLAGDVMLIGPAHFQNYHKRSNTVDVALWPTAWNAREKRLVAAIRAGRVSVAQVGDETIAGRSAAIIVLTAPGAAAGMPGPQAKYWIDTQTGIQLKNEISNASGLVSRSYMTRIAVGSAANVLPRDFTPGFLQTARVNPLFPEAPSEFGTVQEVAGRLTFPPQEPAALPPGFHLGGIWAFGLNNKRPERRSVLLRYTDGVTNFSLFERRVPERQQLANLRKPPAPGAWRRHIQRWRVSASGGDIDVVYIGHLPAEQVQALHDSLR